MSHPYGGLEILGKRLAAVNEKRKKSLRNLFWCLGVLAVDGLLFMVLDELRTNNGTAFSF